MKENARTELLKVITAVQFTKRSLQELNGLTFLFDPNWQPGIGNTATLPLAVFHVKSQQEALETEISQKQLLFYNSSKVATAFSATGGQTQIVADNIITKPKTYKLEVLVPATGLDSGAMLGTIHPYQSGGVTSFLARSGTPSKVYGGITSITEQSFRAINLVYQLITDIVYTDWGNKGVAWLKDLGLNITSTPSYNKESLEAMWRNRTILKMKTWNDWKYKYVVIKNIDLKKDGQSTGVYEGNIVLQEINIMTVRRTLEGAEKEQKPGWINPTIKLAGNILKNIINGKEGN